MFKEVIDGVCQVSLCPQPRRSHTRQHWGNLVLTSDDVEIWSIYAESAKNAVDQRSWGCREDINVALKVEISRYYDAQMADGIRNRECATLDRVLRGLAETH